MSPVPKGKAGHHRRLLLAGRPLDDDDTDSRTKAVHIHCLACKALIAAPYWIVSPVCQPAYLHAGEDELTHKRVSFAASDLGITFEGRRCCAVCLPAPVRERPAEFLTTFVEAHPEVEPPHRRHFSSDPAVLGAP